MKTKRNIEAAPTTSQKSFAKLKAEIIKKSELLLKQKAWNEYKLELAISYEY